MPKRWTSDEIALACQAYVGATDNPIDSADQDFFKFSCDLIDPIIIAELSSMISSSSSLLFNESLSACIVEVDYFRY